MNQTDNRRGLAGIKAALIDMDGTLLDSMPSHARAWHRMVSELGISCRLDEFFGYEGMTGAATIDLIFRRELGRGATDEEKRELYARKTGYFNELPRVPVMPGASRMLSVLMERGIRRVLVTGSGQKSTIGRLAEEFPGAFEEGMMVTSRDVSRGKPDPEPYLLAMRLAGVTPAESLVVENAPLGVRAGAAAGAFTVAVTTGPIPEQEMRDAGADMVFPSMEAFAAALPALLDGQR
ncbi:MAG: HAD-IA family hydrolase [Muribaculaceae bacterium]|nr:HAD-IA family hydrolase [Muribaculaceae bacterium]